MDQPSPSFENILSDNHLIKGKLQLSPKDLYKLYRSMIKQVEQSQKKLEKQQRKIQLHLRTMSQLKFELRKNHETLQKAFYPSNDNISLLYKKMGQQYYIKARIYWGGQQREVQVGSIPITIKLLKKMKKNDIIKIDYKLPRANQLSWEMIKKNDLLIASIKSIAAIKFQEYIIRKIMSEKMKTKIVKKLSNNKVLELEQKEPDTKSIIELEEDTSDYHSENQTNWYIQWRENNLK